MNHQDKSIYALEHARSLNDRIKDMTGCSPGIADPLSDYWQIMVSEDVVYNIFPDVNRPDLYVERYDMKNNINIRYDDVEEAFADLNKEAQKLGFELSRISNFGMIYRDLDAKKAIYIIETEYEKGRWTLDGDNHFDAYHKFHELNSGEHEKNIAERCERGGRTERRERSAHQRSFSGPRVREYVTTQKA